MLDPTQLWRALPQALRKLNPVALFRNPVMFVTEVGAALTTGIAVFHPGLFGRLIAGWLWLTVVFADLAKAVAESRGEAQADSLRGTRQQTTAWRLAGREPGATQDAYLEEAVAARELRRGDIVSVPAGELIPGDGDVIQGGAASFDESAITGESAPVVRESGGDRSAVTGGTRVFSDHLVVRITQERRRPTAASTHPIASSPPPPPPSARSPRGSAWWTCSARRPPRHPVSHGA
jgi:K+-transporting ATPase ATPase B chain